MKKLKLISFIILAIAAKYSFSQYYTEGKTPQRMIINLNSRWLFKSGDTPSGQSIALNETPFQPV